MKKIYSPVVSQVVPVGFADVAQAAETLPGHELSEGRTRLKVQSCVGTGVAGAVRYSATLRTTAAPFPAVKVEVVVSPWSEGRSEIAIQPVSNLGQFDSLHASRYFKAARSILPVVTDRLFADLPVEVPATVGLAA